MRPMSNMYRRIQNRRPFTRICQKIDQKIVDKVCFGSLPREGEYLQQLYDDTVHLHVSGGLSVDACVAAAGGARQLCHGLPAAAAAEAGGAWPQGPLAAFAASQQ